MTKRISTYLAVLFMLTGCKDEPIIRDYDKINKWIHEIMEKNYLWADYMPSDWEAKLNTRPESFFNQLLYNEHEELDYNDLYSSIIFTGDENDYLSNQTGSEYAAESPAYHYGFAARLLANSFCHITYVIPGSPAARAGVNRGDCFKTVNGTDITELGQLQKMMGESRMEIDFYYPEQKKVSLVKSLYYDNPVHFDTIYDLSPKTGYIVYNHFTDGDNDRYYNALKKVFARFRQEGVENVVVDFRFNGGGEMVAARKISSLLAPQEALGSVYLYKERARSFGQPDLFESERLYSASQMNGYNCGLKSLYVLTNKNTASASELVIHCLRPLYDNAGLKFVHAGEVTEGKNVGGAWYSNSQYEWELYPITLRVHNMNKVSGYETGLVPDISISEYSADEINYTESGEAYVTLGQLGEIPEELMLRRVMDDIYGIGGWQDLLPPDQRGSDRSSQAAAALSRSSFAATGERTTVVHRPLIERRYEF